jgi:hypothetical protein
VFGKIIQNIRFYKKKERGKEGRGGRKKRREQ